MNYEGSFHIYIYINQLLVPVLIVSLYFYTTKINVLWWMYYCYKIYCNYDYYCIKVLGPNGNKSLPVEEGCCIFLLRSCFLHITYVYCNSTYNLIGRIVFKHWNTSTYNKTENLLKLSWHISFCTFIFTVSPQSQYLYLSTKIPRY